MIHYSTSQASNNPLVVWEKPFSSYDAEVGLRFGVIQTEEPRRCKVNSLNCEEFLESCLGKNTGSKITKLFRNVYLLFETK